MEFRVGDRVKLYSKEENPNSRYNQDEYERIDYMIIDNIDEREKSLHVILDVYRKDGSIFYGAKNAVVNHQDYGTEIYLYLPIKELIENLKKLEEKWKT